MPDFSLKWVVPVDVGGLYELGAASWNHGHTNLELFQLLLCGIADVIVPGKKALGKHRRADDLLQKLRSQVVVEEGAAGPAKMEPILELGDDLLNWSLVLQYNVRWAFKCVRSSGQHDSNLS